MDEKFDQSKFQIVFFNSTRSYINLPNSFINFSSSFANLKSLAFDEFLATRIKPTTTTALVLVLFEVSQSIFLFPDKAPWPLSRAG